MPGIPGRGERIGSAYVRVYYKGDDSGLNDPALNKDAEKAGRDLGEARARGYEEEWAKRIEAMNADERKRWDYQGRYIKGQTTKTTKEIGRIWERYYAAQKEEGAKSVEDHIIQSQALLKAVQNEDKRLLDDMNRVATTVGDSMKKADLPLKDLDGSIKKVKDSIEGLGRDFRLVTVDTADTLAKWGGRLDNAAKSTDKFAQSWTKVGDSVSSVLGGGSRNNFLNVFGKFVGGIINAPAGIISAFSKISKGIEDNIIKPLQQSVEETGSLTQGIEGIAANFGKIGAGGGAGIGVLIVLIEGLVSMLELAAGAVIALASSLSFALVGGIVAVGGALAPLAVVFGTVMLAMTAMKNQSGKIVGPMKEIGKEFKGLGKIAASQIFTPKLMGGLAQLLKELTPLIKETAAWIGGLGQSFVDAATGPGAQQFFTFLSHTVPRLLNMWKPILGNLAQFFGELFMGSIPLAKDFLGWLSGITKELADWGKGGKGSGLSKFLDQAQTSMHAVGHALAPLVGLIGDLLFNPQIAKAGDDMWKQIGDSIQRVRDWLRKAQKDGSLKSFFDDSKKFAEALGGIIGQVIRLVKILSKPEVRKSVVLIAEAFYVVIKALVDLVGQVVWAYGKIWNGAAKVWHFIRTEGPKAWDAVKHAWSNAGSWFSNKFHAIVQAFVSTWHAITHAASTAWHAISSGASNMANAIGNFIRGMGNRIQSIWNTVTGVIKSGISNAASFVGNKVGDIVNWIQGIPGKVGNVGSDIYHHIYDALKSLPGDIVSLFTGLGSQILHAIGSINISSLIHGPAALLHKIGLAQGGIVLGPMSPLIGERGPEAVVPLTGPLNQVDPAVRALSEIARQMYGGGGQTAPAPAPAGRTIDIGGIVIQGSTADPRAVAVQVVNRIAAATYL